ncbi:MAG: peptidylprolyl isomerase, partial [Rhodanobacteraceae bacterium]
MLKRALFLLALSMPAFALAQTEPAKPAAKAPAKTAPAKPAAAKPKPAEAAPAADAAKAPVASKVLIKTSAGDMTVELYPDKSPKSVENFLTYVNSGFYDGTIFHRVIDNFMIQGGGFTRELRQKPTRPAIANEAKNGLSNTRGTLAMARTGDPNSAT